ncbi:uncharacterized protein HD556DRAFT_1443370 [Suillus plorans]|uniref:Uncharacterized protein n=1 Tax=Suillus plorans TaxID=116603 RepID=A0A9P7APZ9_9AGAM|nr:uncharacterized protein HD556DRAFT_1443370 [Suillus plorans]KAG1794002.1 hypothetical protein HD556DRAFT_1443370 [Suillus plorans]
MTDSEDEEMADADDDDEDTDLNEHKHAGHPLKPGIAVSLPAFALIPSVLQELKTFPSYSARSTISHTFRLKACFPTARGSSSHHLFVSAFMLASKSWSIVTQGMFQLREINQMEREMCQYLDPYPTYTLPSPSKTTPPPTTDPFPSPPADLAPTPSYGHHYPSPPKPPYSAGPAISHAFISPLLTFAALVLLQRQSARCKDFVGQGPYPTYTLPSPSKTTPPPTTNPFPSPPAALAPTPSYGHRYPSPPGPAFPPYSAGPAISHTFMILPTSFSHFHNVHPGVWRIALLIIRYIMAIIIIRIFNPSLLHARFLSHLYLNLLFY